MATLEQIEKALRAADAAGNVDDARRLAQAYAQMRGQGAAPNFAGVTSSVDSTEQVQPGIPGMSGQGTSADDFRSFVSDIKKGYDPAATDAANMANKTRAFNDLPAAGRFAIGAGSRVARLGRGVGQLAGVTTESGESAARDRDAYMNGDLPSSVGKVVTDMGLAFLPSSKVAAIPSLGGRVAANSLIGATTGAIAPVTDGESRAGNSAVQGLLGAGGEVVAKGLGALANVTRAEVSQPLRQLYDAAAKRGIQLTPAQLSDSRLMQYLGSKLREYPLTGARKVAGEQVSQFNRELSKMIGSDSPHITPDVFAAAKKGTQETFERLTQNARLPVSAKLTEQLGTVLDDATAVADEPVVKAVNTFVGRVMAQAENGVLSGRAYQSIDSKLGEAMKAGGEKAHYLGQVRETLRDAMDDAIPESMSTAWQQARRQWAVQKTIEPLVAKTTDGVISPAALMGRVTATKAGKSRMASNNAGEMGELARIGQRLKEPQSSGTSQFRLADSLLNPLNLIPFAARTAVGATVGRIPNSPFAGQLMMEGGATSQGLRALSRVAPGTGLAVAPVVNAKVRKERRRDD